MWTLPCDPTSAAVARRLVREAATLLTVAAQDAAELLASELVTNAVCHGEPPIQLTVQGGGGAIEVAVSDGATARPILRPTALEDIGGRGIRLVDMLATAWGVRDQLVGKAVWFLIDDSLRAAH